MIGQNCIIMLSRSNLPAGPPIIFSQCLLVILRVKERKGLNSLDILYESRAYIVIIGCIVMNTKRFLLFNR